MNQTNRTRKNRNRTQASARRPDATEAALSLILPPAAFKVFRVFLGLARAHRGDPAMTMREAFAHLECAHGCDVLEATAGAFAEAFRDGRTIG
jgi:hypothetical protein